VTTDTNSTRPAARGASAGAPRRPAADDDAPETESERRMVNLLLVGIVLLIVAAAIWLGDALLDARRADECMASGRRNCAPVTVPAPPER
jgi:hypothetical protein